MGSLIRLGFSPAQAVQLLAHPELAAAAAAPPPPGRGMLTIAHLGELFDASDRIEAASAAVQADVTDQAADEPKKVETILYWNDIERDSRYRQWPRSLQGLLSPMYPGQMPQVRRNLITVVLALDLSKRDAHALLADNIATLISRGVGVRFGLVPLLDGAESQMDVQRVVAKVLWYLVDTAGRASAIAFSREVSPLHQPAHS